MEEEEGSDSDSEIAENDDLSMDKIHRKVMKVNTDVN